MKKSRKQRREERLLIKRTERRMLSTPDSGMGRERFRLPEIEMFTTPLFTKEIAGFTNNEKETAADEV